MLWLFALCGFLVWLVIAWGMWEQGIWWFVGMMIFSLIFLTGQNFLSRWVIFFPIGALMLVIGAMNALGYCGGNDEQTRIYTDDEQTGIYTDDYLQEYYINVQAGLQDAEAISGIPIGGVASRAEFNAACELLEAMGFRHNNTNNFVMLLEQEPEETLERLRKFNSPYALINQVGRNAAVALRAGVIMGAIEGDPSFPESQQKALCEYVANR